MDFNDYCKNAKFESVNKNNINDIKTDSSHIKNQSINEQQLQQTLNKFKSMSQNDLMTELLKETNKQKQNGNLNDKKLQDLSNQLKPMLDSSQQAKLDEILKMLR